MPQEIPPVIEEYPPRYCPECGPEAGYMGTLLFLGIQPDGYVCKSCNGYFDEIDGQLKHLAMVIGL
jgi:hypothetical protein